MKSSEDQELTRRLKQYPKLRNRVESLLNVVENVAGDCTKADAAERYVIEELRKMGNDVLHCWGDNAATKSAEQFSEKSPSYHRHGKKKFIGIQLLEK